MNETRRTALEFALRFKPKTNLDVIRVAMLFEAYLTNDDKSLLELFGGSNPGAAESQEVRP